LHAYLLISQICLGNNKWLIPQAVIDLAADIAHAVTVVTDVKYTSTAGLIEIAPFSLALRLCLTTCKPG